jgi:hypothetical protein
MSDFSIRADSVDVEQIMRQIRARIREKRGVDYTEADIRTLASVKLEKFLDPKNVRSDLVEHYRRQHPKTRWPELPPLPPLPLPPSLPQPPAFLNYGFEQETIYLSSRGVAGRLLALVRKLLNPVLKLFFNPNPIIHVLHMQGEINARYEARFAEHLQQFDRVADAVARLKPIHEELYRMIAALNELLGHKFAGRDDLDALHYEVLNNLVVEMSRLGIGTKNLEMRVESLSSRLDFDERRSRALEGVVQYRPDSAEPGGAQRELFPGGEAGPAGESPAQAGGEGPRSRRRRRRRGGRGRGPRIEGAPSATAPPSPATSHPEPDVPPAPRGSEKAAAAEGQAPAAPMAGADSQPVRSDGGGQPRPQIASPGSPGPDASDQ